LSNATVLLLDDAGAAVATQTLGDTCNQLEIELSDFIPNSGPDNYDDDFYSSYSPTSFPTLFPTSSPSGAPSTSEQPTLNPTRASKSGKNSNSGLADTPTISIGNNSVTIPISSLFDCPEEELKSLAVESIDGGDMFSGSSWIQCRVE
jgi:hypothetical protein